MRKKNNRCTIFVLLEQKSYKKNENAYHNRWGDDMIKNHLSKLLGERRWTQADLARKTGIRRATINELYNELADRVSLEHLDRICEALDYDLSDLLEYIPNPQRKTGTDLIMEEHGNRKRLNGK